MAAKKYLSLTDLIRPGTDLEGLYIRFNPKAASGITSLRLYDGGDLGAARRLIPIPANAEGRIIAAAQGYDGERVTTSWPPGIGPTNWWTTKELLLKAIRECDGNLYTDLVCEND